ncbi:receptor-type tyrosine-protein phosphatase epsilon-like isoform X3 [Nerophis ophidion]|uniref:receptor-type tyrosine-protein phosphatase epsilon-like isoform X3 n=1 Tax=Nerophis ophidion TaxID=159077 RepID=UPI002AE0A961|nr:receptor-type tyrosine-protein phosphatase epsilon-like isoform X3 [Nerophis ophidion]
MRSQNFSKAQILQDFESVCQTHSASNNRGFKQEFEKLNDVGKDLSIKVGELEANREKNRYPYILPYDHCRVRLSIQNSNPNSDYINANFVPGGGSERDFICTQGPTQNTIVDFWRMVWEQNVRVIVMVTAVKHKDIRDCLTERIITHYQYPSWPDRGVPTDPSSLCSFTNHVRCLLQAMPRLGPAVVHCSAGVGRSGTFVALLWMMQLCMCGRRPDIRAAVADLRLRRMWMVQTLEQYIFVHQCLLYWLRSGTSQGFTHLEHANQEAGGRNRHHRRKTNSEEPQSTLQLLRRLLPSSLLNLGSHAS